MLGCDVMCVLPSEVQASGLQSVFFSLQIPGEWRIWTFHSFWAEPEGICSSLPNPTPAIALFLLCWEGYLFLANTIFSQFYFTFASMLTSINTETGQKLSQSVHRVCSARASRKPLNLHIPRPAQGCGENWNAAEARHYFSHHSGKLYANSFSYLLFISLLTLAKDTNNEKYLTGARAVQHGGSNPWGAQLGHFLLVFK